MKHIVQFPVVDMRKEPSSGSELVSQCLFGEEVQIIQEKSSWLKITTPDGYSGWVLKDSLISLAASYNPSLFTHLNATPVYAQKSIQAGPVMMLPFGVGVNTVNQPSNWATITLPSGNQAYIQKGYLRKEQVLAKQDLPKFALEFLKIPYIWGGRSSFGYDCSSFVQVLYRQMGILLKRDANLQHSDPQFEEKEELSPCDLIFWGKSKERIGHVGLYLGDDEFIHATTQEKKPWIRISSLTDPFWNPETSPTYPYRCYRAT